LLGIVVVILIAAGHFSNETVSPWDVSVAHHLIIFFVDITGSNS
jgi:hypothetical protein